MNIIFANREDAAEMTARYILLELDTFRINDEVKISWCVLDPVTVPMTELWQVDTLRGLHAKLLESYQTQNWKNAAGYLEQLVGKWACQVDSYYAIMKKRLEDLTQYDMPDWTHVIDKQP